MAEPVIVPVQLEVTDIDMSNFNPKDVQKQISSSLNGVRKSIEQTFSQIDPSKANKSILNGVRSLENSFIKLNSAQQAFYRESVKAGKATAEYKNAVSELDKAKAQLTTLEKIRASWENKNGDYVGTPEMWETYLDACKDYETQLYKVQDLQDKVDDPGNFAQYADQFAQAKVESSLRKLVSAVASFNQESEKFNQTMQDNRASDEYNELIKQAEAYKKKLADLNEKSEEMEFKGATDKQWENLSKETEWTSMKMDEVIKKMREAVKTGKAFRFGEGPKKEFSNQINSFGMSARNNAGFAVKRAQKNQSPYTEDYQNALNELDKLEKQMDKLREKSAKMIALGASKQQFEKLAYDAENLDVKVDEVKNSLMRMAESGKAFKFGTGDTGAEIAKIRDKADGMQSSLTGIATGAKKAQGGLAALGATNPKLAAILTTAGKIAGVMGKIAQGAGKVASVFGTIAKSIISGVRSMNIFGKAGRTTSTDLNKRFKKLGSNILMFGFGFRTAYYAVKRLRNIFVEGFQVMGDQFDEVGQPMMRLIEAFNRLKGSVATAFQPIVSVVMPILTRFLNYLSGVLEAIGKFNAVLTGQGYIYKAIAKDVNSVAKAAKNANNQLASYDKLEVINQDNTDFDYEKQAVGGAESAASNFANMVKEAWKNADFTGVGQYVTTKLLEVLDNVEKNIIPKVTDLVNRVLRSVNTFFDGFDSTAIGDKIGSIFNVFVDGIEWDQIGLLFANLYNEVWDFFDGLVNRLDWTLLGQSLNTGLTSLVGNLNFESLASLATGLTMGLFTALSQIDWAYLANTLLTGLQTVLQSLGSAMASSDNPIVAGFGEVILAINDTISILKPAIEEIIAAVGPIITSILPIITKLLPPIAQIVSDVVVILLPPLVRLFEALLPPVIRLVEVLLPPLNLILNKLATEIANAADVITYFIIPAFDLLVSIIEATVAPITILFKALRGEFGSVKELFTELLKAWKKPLNSILGAVESMVNGIIRGINSMIKAMNRISFDIPDWVPAIGGNKFGFNLKELNTISIPRLAQGAVIPPNKEFLAMLGDQKSGTNIEAPLDTIKQALAEVLAEMGGGSKEPIILQVNGRTLAKVVWDEQEKHYKQTGRYAMA